MREPAVAAKDANFLDHIVLWAKRQPDISALVMTGSRAQPDGAVDDLSDYDLEIFTSDPSFYTSSDGWMSEIARVWVYLPTEREALCETRLVVFEGGAKADFSIRPVESLEVMVKSQQLDELYERGYRVLIDKEGLASKLPAPSYTSVRQLPTEAEFEAAVNEFWFEASHIPKYLQRNELWVVKSRDWTMKELLLQMMEWRASAANRAVRQIGVRMKDWVPRADWHRLNEVFGRFDAADSWRALLATLSFFREVATETADRLGYAYPVDIDASISGYIQRFRDSPFAS